MDERRETRIGGLTAVAVVAALGAVVLGVISLTADGERSQSFDLVVAEDRENDFENDLGENGESAGDVFGSVDPLQRNGETAGTGFLLCTATGTEREPRGICTGVLELEGGSILAEGAIDFVRDDQAQQFAIVGGTGDYEGGRGTLTIQPGEGKTPLSVDVTTES